MYYSMSGMAEVRSVIEVVVGEKKTDDVEHLLVLTRLDTLF